MKKGSGTILGILEVSTLGSVRNHELGRATAIVPKQIWTGAVSLKGIWWQHNQQGPKEPWSKTPDVKPRSSSMTTPKIPRSSPQRDFDLGWNGGPHCSLLALRIHTFRKFWKPAPGLLPVLARLGYINSGPYQLRSTYVWARAIPPCCRMPNLMVAGKILSPVVLTKKGHDVSPQETCRPV